MNTKSLTMAMPSLILAVGSISMLNATSLWACTAGVLTDSKNTLFFNNEDWDYPNTRIWFVPGSEDYFGVAYVGLDNGRGIGGINEKGLAYDAFSGNRVEYKPATHQKEAVGHLGHLLLETCSTVEEAISFFKTYRNPGFAQESVLIADKTGASVHIRVKDGKLAFDRSEKSYGYGYCGKKVKEMVASNPRPQITNGANILKTCLQDGNYPTQYSNIFDLTTGDIYLYRFGESKEPVKMNLFDELKKGGHYYEIPNLKKDSKRVLKPLSESMKHKSLYNVNPLSKQEPKIKKLVEKIFQDMANGTMQKNDFTDGAWFFFESVQQPVFNEVRGYGKLVDSFLVGSHQEKRYRNYYYIVVFENIRFLQRLVLDRHNKIVYFRGILSGPKSPAESR